MNDIAAIASLARSRDIHTIVDNTFATPINQRPLELGIEVVVHSATKFLGGHGDAIGGIVVGSKRSSSLFCGARSVIWAGV